MPNFSKPENNHEISIYPKDLSYVHDRSLVHLGIEYFAYGERLWDNIKTDPGMTFIDAIFMCREFNECYPELTRYYAIRHSS